MIITISGEYGASIFEWKIERDDWDIVPICGDILALIVEDDAKIPDDKAIWEGTTLDFVVTHRFITYLNNGETEVHLWADHLPEHQLMSSREGPRTSR